MEDTPYHSVEPAFAECPSAPYRVPLSSPGDDRITNLRLTRVRDVQSLRASLRKLPLFPGNWASYIPPHLHQIEYEPMHDGVWDRPARQNSK